MACVAWLSAETPDSAGGGGQRRQFHQIQALVDAGVATHVITLAGPQDHTSIAKLAPVTRFRWRWADRLTGRNHQLAKLLSSGSFTSAVVAHVESVPHVRAALARVGMPWLLDFHNVNSRWHRAMGEYAEMSAWEAKESDALRLVDRATACSDEERDALLALDPSADVVTAGHGVDRSEWPEEALSPARDPLAVLFGSWQHGPNAEGARWLTSAVWPQVRAELPDAKLVLAGPGDPPDECLAAEGVSHAGRVDNLAALLGRARVVVVPILRGIGARVKFGEALASGAAVVSTSAGAEGFSADGVYERADDAASFAAACARLLADEEQARALGAAGRMLAFERLTWAHTSRPLVEWSRRLR